MSNINNSNSNNKSLLDIPSPYDPISSELQTMTTGDLDSFYNKPLPDIPSPYDPISSQSQTMITESVPKSSKISTESNQRIFITNDKNKE